MNIIDEHIARSNRIAIRDLASKTSITTTHQFADATARDAYFVTNPTELTEGLFIKVGTGYQQYLSESWEDVSAVLIEQVQADTQLITDAGGYYTSNNTEGALQEVGAELSEIEADRQLDNLKVATIEKDLKDYQQTLAQVNVNQEAKQSVTGYGNVSFPKNTANGQVSAVVKGNTITNKAGIGDTSPQTITLDSTKTYLLIKTDGGTVNIDGVDTAVPTKITSKASTTLTWTTGKIGMYELLSTETGLATDLAKKYTYVTNTKSTISAGRLKSVSEDETQESLMYLPNVGELRSLPNGTKDEVSIINGVATETKRNDEVIIDGNLSWISLNTTLTNTYRMAVSGWASANNALQDVNESGYGRSEDGDYTVTNEPVLDTKNIRFNGGYLLVRIEKSKVDVMTGSTTEEKFKAYLNQYPIILTYQLATPIEIPIEVSGTLLSYPSGTIYVENAVADAGIYSDKFTILNTDLPIKEIEKISKVDFNTGVETELDVSLAVIAPDGSNFAHPDLTENDITFATYFFDKESTEGELTAEYYDSRYVLKDSVTGKYYKIVQTVADGVLTQTLVEV